MTTAPLILLALSLYTATAETAPPAGIGPAAVPQKAILVTGASTGFGRRITERLAAGGYFVYATARKESDLAALGAIPNVKALRLDVTKPSEIAAAVEVVTAEGRGLQGLVNNAGVSVLGRIDQSTDADFQYVMDVNALGVFRMTRAFLPLIQASKGRIVNVGSVSGLNGRMLVGVYSMSKHAVEAFTESLALEMAPAGVSVSIVEPGQFKTAIAEKLVKHQKDSGTPNPPLLKWLETAYAAGGKDPEEVAVAVRRALQDERPQLRYMVPNNKAAVDYFVTRQMEKLVQINANHPYGYSRDELVALLDATLAVQASGSWSRGDAMPQSGSMFRAGQMPAAGPKSTAGVKAAQ